MSPAPTFPVQQVDRENTQSCVDEREQGGKKVQSNTTCLESNSLVSGCTLPLTSCMTSCQWLPFSQPPFLICKAGVGITSNCRVVLKIKCVNGLQQGLACRKPLRNTAPPFFFNFSVFCQVLSYSYLTEWFEAWSFQILPSLWSLLFDHFEI